MIEIGYEGENIKKVLKYLLKQVIAGPKIYEWEKLINIAQRVKGDIVGSE